MLVLSKAFQETETLTMKLSFIFHDVYIPFIPLASTWPQA